MSTYRVVDGTQVNHEGLVYGEGETFDADPEIAAPWLAAGLVINWGNAPVDAKRSARRKPPAIR